MGAGILGQHQQTLNDSPDNECRLVAVGLDHIVDRNVGEGSSKPVRAGHQADAQAAPVREPFHSDADAGAVNAAGPDAANGVRNVQRGERVGQAGSNPPHAHQKPGQRYDNARANPISEVGIDRKQNSLGDHEKGKGPLDCIQAGMQTPGQISREERPGVLEIRDGRHRNHAGDEPEPT